MVAFPLGSLFFATPETYGSRRPFIISQLGNCLAQALVIFSGAPSFMAAGLAFMGICHIKASLACTLIFDLLPK